MSLLVLRACVNLCITVWLGNRKASGVLAMGDLVQLCNPFLRHAVAVHVSPAGINRLAVNTDHGSHIMHALHAAFNFQAAHTGTHQLRQILNEAQILGVHHIGSVLILFEVKVFAGALLLTQLIHIVFPAAGLRAGTTVAVTPSKISAQQAASAVGNAHCAMHKGFQLNGGFLADFADFLERQLACQNNTLCAKLLPRLHCSKVRGVRLRAHMQRQLRHNLTRRSPHAQVANQQSIYLRRSQAAQIIRQLVDIFIMCKNVDGYVHLLAQAMRIGCHLCNFLKGKIVGEGTQAKHLAAQINCIRTVEQSHLALLHISGRS